MEYKYDKMSPKAEEFINDREIWDTIAYAKANKDNRELIDSLLGRAADCRGLSHRKRRYFWNVRFRKSMRAVKSLAREIKKQAVRQPYCYVCASVFVQLLCQWMYLLPVSSL